MLWTNCKTKALLKWFPKLQGGVKNEALVSQRGSKPILSKLPFTFRYPSQLVWNLQALNKCRPGFHLLKNKGHQSWERPSCFLFWRRKLCSNRRIFSVPPHFSVNSSRKFMLLFLLFVLPACRPFAWFWRPGILSPTHTFY